jgi:hypothetical protein
LVGVKGSYLKMTTSLPGCEALPKADPPRPLVGGLHNTADAVSSAFPKGKQNGCLDITGSAFHKITQKDRKERLLLLF